MTKDEGRRFIIITLHGLHMIEEDNHPVGKLSISRQDQKVGYMLCFNKEKRGQGIGRAALTDIVHRSLEWQNGMAGCRLHERSGSNVVSYMRFY